MQDKSSGGFIIGGTHSGCGKTTVTLGLIGALKKRGLSVSPWKSGPDYIDPGFHSRAAGKICRNLDSMLLSDQSVREIYDRNCGGISLIEGVMGLFDGAGPLDERGSAAHLSKLLQLPVILIIDAKAMARSAAAIALGFSQFDEDIKIAGFIMNRVGSERHFDILKESIESKMDIPVLGYLPKDATMSIPERHLGLVNDLEDNRWDTLFSSIVENVETHIDIDRLLKIATCAKPRERIEPILFSPSLHQQIFIKIAVARDLAFQFYYEDNLDLLRHLGAEICFFSPLEDKYLPEDISAVYFGGGYPELFARQLTENSSLRNQLVRLAEKGMPIYGECGGFMYLTEGIIDKDGVFFPMTGILPGRAKMGKKLRSLGYCSTELKEDTVLGVKGTKAMGHVFHWAELVHVDEAEDRAFTVSKGEKLLEEGFFRANVLGSWVHHHFASNIKMASAFIDGARKYRSEYES